MPLTIRHFTDETGADQGGTVQGDGVYIKWPGTDPGADALEVLGALIARLQHLETIATDPDRVAAIADLQAAEADLSP